MGEVPALDMSRVNVDCEQWLQSVEDMRKKVQAHVTKVHDRVADTFRRKFGNTQYAVGDRVWIRCSKDRMGNRKLDPLWVGPCEVLDHTVGTGRYKVEMPKGPEDVHMEDMKPYLPSVDGTAIPCLYYKPRSALPTSDLYVVDRILDHKIKNGKHLWKVRWRGYGSEGDTWEPASSFVGFVHQDWRRWNKDHNVEFSLSQI